MGDLNLEYLFSSGFLFQKEYDEMEKMRRGMEVMFKDVVWLLHDKKKIGNLIVSTWKREGQAGNLMDVCKVGSGMEKANRSLKPEWPLSKAEECMFNLAQKVHKQEFILRCFTWCRLSCLRERSEAEL